MIDLPVIVFNEHPVYYFDNSSNFSATGVRVEDFQFRGLMTPGQVITRPPVIPPIRPGESIPGTLNISLQWISDQATGPNLPDLDLFVLTPRGERIFPLDKPFTTASGGRVSANDRGGQQATLGFESVNWNRRYPVGEYKYGVRYRGEGDPANYRITIFQNGRQINAEFDDVVTQFDRRATFEIDVKPEAPRAGRLKLTGGDSKGAANRTGRRK